MEEGAEIDPRSGEPGCSASHKSDNHPPQWRRAQRSTLGEVRLDIDSRQLKMLAAMEEGAEIDPRSLNRSLCRIVAISHGPQWRRAQRSTLGVCT